MNNKAKESHGSAGDYSPAGVDEMDPSLAAAPCYRIRQGLWALDGLQRADEQTQAGPEDRAELLGRNLAAHRRDAEEEHHDSQVREQNAQEDRAAVSPEMGVEIGDYLTVFALGKRHAGRDIEDGGNRQPDHQQRHVEGCESEDEPGLIPEGDDVDGHEHRQQRRQPAESNSVTLMQYACEPTDQFGHGKAKQQAVKAEEELERAHEAPT